MEIVSDRCQHCDEAVASICQRKSTELVEDVLYVGDGGKKTLEVSLVDALREKGNNSEEVTGARAKFAECGGSEREFDGCCLIRLKNPFAVFVPLVGESITVPCVVGCGGCK